MNNQWHRMSSHLSRRWFLKDCGVGLGAIAAARCWPTRPVRHRRRSAWHARRPHFPGKVKNVIFLFMAGAPSHLELFDNKPQLAKFDGTLPPAGIVGRLSCRLHQSELETCSVQSSNSPGTVSVARRSSEIAAAHGAGRR